MSRTHGFYVDKREPLAEIAKLNLRGASYLIWDRYIWPRNARHHARGKHTLGHRKWGCHCCKQLNANIHKIRRMEAKQEIRLELRGLLAEIQGI